MLSIIPVTRMTPNITRIAKSDGIIAISRAVPLRKINEEGAEDDHHGEHEALSQRRHQALRHLGLQRRQADGLQLDLLQRRVGRLRRLPSAGRWRGADARSPRRRCSG